MRVFNLRELRTHPVRISMSLGVVVVASALLVAVLGAFGSLTESVRQTNAAISGSAQVEVTGVSDNGIDQRLAGAIRSNVDAVRTVVPVIRTSVNINGASVALLGSDQRFSSLSSELRQAMSTAGSRSPIALDDLRDGIVAGPGTGLTEGQRLVINGVDVRVLSVIDDSAAQMVNQGAFIFAYLPLAQRITARDGLVDSLFVVTRPDADLTAVRAGITSVIDGRAVVVNPEFRAQQAAAAGGITRDATLLVSLVSLIVAAFLVFNTMTMAVAARRRSLAMMRALGTRRSHLAGDLVAESVVLGLVGGALGIPFGVLGGRWAVGQLGGVSDALTTVVSFHLPGYAIPVAIAACVLACVVPAAVAARGVYAVSPLEAMSSTAIESGDVHRRRRGRWLSGFVGVALVIASWVIATSVDSRGVVLAGAVYVVGAMLICVCAGPYLSGAVGAIAGRLAGPGRLAAVNTERAPQRTWATVMTVAVAVAVGMGTSGALDNMIGSLSSALDGYGDPDFYVSSSDPDSTPKGPLLSDEIKPSVQAVPGVAEVVGMQWAAVNLGEARILVQGLNSRTQAPFMKKASPQALQQVLESDGILLSTVLARSLGVQVGDELTLATPSGHRVAVVRDIVDYLSVASGTAAIADTTLREWFHRPGDTYLQVSVAPGADRDLVRRELERIVAAHPLTGGLPVQVYSGSEALAATEASVKQAGAFTMAIQWIVAAAAAIALLNTLLLSVLDRRRDLAVLRALGASRRFVARMVLGEAFAMAIVGCAVGIAIGALLHVLADRILSAMTYVDIAYSPRPTVIGFVLVAGLLCIVGALIPARRAARMNISRALLSD
nr:FtsX-like permease family protein [Gordonia bronchialis]